LPFVGGDLGQVPTPTLVELGGGEVAAHQVRDRRGGLVGTGQGTPRAFRGPARKTLTDHRCGHRLLRHSPTRLDEVLPHPQLPRRCPAFHRSQQTTRAPRRRARRVAARDAGRVRPSCVGTEGLEPPTSTDEVDRTALHRSGHRREQRDCPYGVSPVRDQPAPGAAAPPTPLPVITLKRPRTPGATPRARRAPPPSTPAEVPGRRTVRPGCSYAAPTSPRTPVLVGDPRHAAPLASRTRPTQVALPTSRRPAPHHPRTDPCARHPTREREPDLGLPAHPRRTS
jgi:hypothetical protein